MITWRSPLRVRDPKSRIEERRSFRAKSTRHHRLSVERGEEGEEEEEEEEEKEEEEEEEQ